MFRISKLFLMPFLLAVIFTGCSRLNEPGVDMENEQTTMTICKGKEKKGGQCPPLSSSDTTTYYYTSMNDPERIMVTDRANNWLATFTLGSSTVTLAGPTRTFSEPANTSFSVTHTTWVRLSPAPFNGQVDESWLTQALADTSADILGIAMQYIQDAPAVSNTEGLKIAGDTDYGPLQAAGSRRQGADFNDYLGIAWSYASTTDAPEGNEFNSVDCSGYVRMVFGYRSGMPLVLSPDGAALPRTSFQMLDSAPGVVTIPNTGVQVTDFSRLAIGDLVFFDATSDINERIDHVGIFLGVDSGGYHRFISSRQKVNGPTLGDYGGRSILETINGKGLYALAFRAARRL